MATLAADSKRFFESEPAPVFNDLPVVASDIIYEGAAVGDNASGYMRPLSGGDPFRGFAARRVDNSSGSAGDKSVLLRSNGIVSLAVTSAAAVTDVGAIVYASDDDTFTLVGGTGKTAIGKVHRWVSSTTCLVAFQAEPLAAPGVGAVVAKAADYAFVAADNGKFFTTLGASGAVIFTLPAASAALLAAGFEVTVFNAVDQDMTLAGTAGELMFKHDVAANSVAYSTSSEKIGGAFRAKCISASKYAVMPLAEEAQTITVAT
jgi:hypothetical protein